MGCAASIVLLQAFRSVVQRNCPHICRRRRREELSHEILPLDSDDEMSRPRTLIIMVRYTLISRVVRMIITDAVPFIFFDYVIGGRERLTGCLLLIDYSPGRFAVSIHKHG